MTTKPIIFIVGPTASGKTALAIEIAKKYGGEIICADSRTVYRGLDIATAKPTKQEQEAVRHWCIDMVEPNQRYSAAQFKSYALVVLKDIQSRGKIPIIVGGTGLYIDGLLFDYQFGPGANVQLRSQLSKLSIEELQQKIIDSKLRLPENSKNKRYLIRVLEQGGVNTSHGDLMPGAIVIGINPPKEVLRERIRARATKMLQNGALQEAEQLLRKYGYDAPAAAAPFYKAMVPYFINQINLDECLAQYIQNDQRLAKRQITWFKRNQATNWFRDSLEARAFVEKFLTE